MRGYGDMGAGHSHRADARSADVAVPAGPRWTLLVVLAALAVATVVGLVSLWPDGDRVSEVEEDVSFAAPGVTFPRATVTEVQPACPAVTSEDGRATAPQPGEDDACGRISVTVDEGASDGERAQIGVPPHVSASGLEPGDQVRLMRIPVAEGEAPQFSYFGTERPRPLLFLTILFVVVVVAVARHRGLFALVGLAFAAWLIATFLLPGVLSGESAVVAGLVTCSAIMFVVLYITHGFSIRTSVALAGTLAGLSITATLGMASVDSTNLTGVSDEGGGVLQSFAAELDFQGLLICAVMIAGLGVLNDVTITQASAVWELRAASPDMSRRGLWASGMRIGRDHVASTIYTIAFAYAGVSLILLLVLQLYDRPLLDLLSVEEITQEVVRTLVTSIGLVLAMPITTAIAVALVPPPVDPVADALE
jgi:uncharacterized membrane protein